MKNRIITSTLALLLALSSTTAFGAEINTANTINDCNKNATSTVDIQSYLNDYLKNFQIKSEPVQAKTTAAPTAQTAAKPAVQEAAKPVAKTTEAAKTNATASSNLSYEEKVVQLVNVERQKNGLPALALDSAIANVARTKSKDMADNNYFAHQSPTYGSAGDMLTQFGIKWTAWGENIASGQDTPEEVVNAWMNSEGHRANILSANFTKIGVGYVTNSNGTPYWTQMFAR